MLAPTFRADGRSPVPSAEQLAQSRRLVDAIYRDEMAATARPARVELGHKLLERSRAPGTDAATRFVLLTLARETAAGADDDATAFDAIDDTTRVFQVDEAATKIEFVTARFTKASAPDQFWRFVAFLLRDQQRRFEAEEYAAADRLIACAESLAPRADDAELVLRVAQSRLRLAQLQADRDAFAAAHATLAVNPADPHANFVCGFHAAILLGNWAPGLKLLVLGDQADFAGAAALELKAPTDVASRVQIADRWCDVAAKQPPFVQAALRRHAADAFRRVCFELRDAEQARVLKRLAEIDPPPAMPKGTLELDPADWRLYRRPTAEFQPFPLDGSICRSKGEVLGVKNPGDPQGHAKLAFMSRFFEGDFTLWFRYRGQIHLISLGEDFKNRILYFDKVPCERSSWKSFVMRRTGDGLAAWIDGVPAKATLYNCDEFLAGWICVELSNGQEIELRDFAFRGGTPR